MDYRGEFFVAGMTFGMILAALIIAFQQFPH